MIEQWFVIGILLIVIGFSLSVFSYIIFSVNENAFWTIMTCSWLFVSIWGIFQVLISGLVWLVRWAF